MLQSKGAARTQTVKSRGPRSPNPRPLLSPGSSPFARSQGPSTHWRQSPDRTCSANATQVVGFLACNFVTVSEAHCIPHHLSLASEFYFLWRREAKDPRGKTTNNSKNQPMLLSKTVFNSAPKSATQKHNHHRVQPSNSTSFSAFAHAYIALCCQAPVLPCSTGWRLVSGS